MNTRFISLAILAIFCSVIIALALSACGGTPQSAQTIPPVTSTATLPPATQSGPLDGAALFANNCSECHSTTEIAPDVNGLSDTDLAKFIASHNSGVDLTAAQRSPVAGYLVSACVDEG